MSEQNDKSEQQVSASSLSIGDLVIPASAVRANIVTQYVATAAALKFIADVVNDWQSFSALGTRSPFAALAAFGNLAPDLVSVVTNVQSLPAEIESLDDASLNQLLSDFSSEVSLPTDHARAILSATLKIAGDIRANVADVLALIAAIRNKG
jgi:hypothetical protein